MHVSARATNRDQGAFDKEGPRVRARRSDSPSSSGSAFVEWLASALLGNQCIHRGVFVAFNIEERI